jgi:hypothetical protein
MPQGRGRRIVTVDQEDIVHQQSHRASRTALRWAPAGVAVLLLLGYLVLVPAGVVDPGNRLGTGEAVIAAALVVVFFLRGPDVIHD